MEQKRYKNFQEFYSFYLREHSKPLTRALHFLGFILAVAWLIFCDLYLELRYGWCALIIGYGFAWVGHFFVERNRPATFQHPVYSFLGDLRMFLDILRHRRLLFERCAESQITAR